MTITEDEIEMLEYPLKHYGRSVFIEVIDFRKLVLQREEVEDGIYKYSYPGQDIYLNKDGYAVTYATQRVVDDKLYIRVTDDPSVEEDMQWEFRTMLEWKKTTKNWED